MIRFICFVALILLAGRVAEGKTRCWCNTNPPTNTFATKDATFSCCKNQNDRGYSGTPCDVTVMSYLNKNGLTSGTHACAAFDGRMNEPIFKSCLKIQRIFRIRTRRQVRRLSREDLQVRWVAFMQILCAVGLMVTMLSS